MQTTARYLRGLPHYSCKCREWNTLQPWRFTIPDPWDGRWEKGVKGKLYQSIAYLYPQSTLEIYRTLVPVPINKTVLANTILDQEQSLQTLIQQNEQQANPFSWLSLINQHIQIFNITNICNISNCFLCAYLDQSPIAAVPISTPLNVTNSVTPFLLKDVPLFQNLMDSPQVCYTTASTSSCNQTVQVSGTTTSPPGTFFWCNGMLLRTINSSSAFPCFPTVLTPQLIHYGEGELRDKLTRHREKQAVFLLMLVGLTFTTTLAAAGIGSAGLAHSLQTTHQLQAELEQALDASATSLASLQRQDNFSSPGCPPEPQSPRPTNSRKRGNMPLPAGTVLLLCE